MRLFIRNENLDYPQSRYRHLLENTVHAVLELDSLSDESAESSIIDDTDKDPWYEPDPMPTISTGRPMTKMIVGQIPNLTELGLKGRPAGGPTVNEDRLDDHTSDEDQETDAIRPVWQAVTEDNGPGSSHNFLYGAFFTLSLRDCFIKFTNKYTRRFIEANLERLHNTNRLQQWKNLTVVEMFAFLVVLFNITQKLPKNPQWVFNIQLPCQQSEPVEDGGRDCDAGGKLLEKLPEKREINCSVCNAANTSNGGKRRKTTFVCKRCKKGVHLLVCLPHHMCVTV
ncbi:hypothetical protein J6590_079534 [Homalodisca vitripennis]|nr:hypothetical protein J6590_079534 [Homalodisca vitripennis]